MQPSGASTAALRCRPCGTRAKHVRRSGRPVVRASRQHSSRAITWSLGFAEAIDHDGAILGRSSVVQSGTPLGWDLDMPVVAVTESGHDRQRQGTTLHKTWTSTHANGLVIGGSCLILVLFGAVVMLVLQRPSLLSAGYRTALLRVIKDKHFRAGEEGGLEEEKLLSSTSAGERD
jgi:hypothetical protein